MIVQLPADDVKWSAAQCSLYVFLFAGYTQSGHNTSGSQSMESGCQIGGSTGRGSLGRNTGSLGGNRGSLASVGKPTSSTLASLAGLLGNSDIKTEPKSETSFSSKMEKEEVYQRVRVSVSSAVIDVAHQSCVISTEMHLFGN